MKVPRVRRRFCRGWLIGLGLLAVPPALWVLAVTVVPTDCARRKIAERLSAASGRKVELGRVCVGACGGVYLTDLRIGAPASAGDDPWLRVGEASINVSLLQLVFGHVDPTEIVARKVHLRVLRRRDGRLELADFLQPAGRDSAPVGGAENPDAGPTGLTVYVREATVLVIDEPTGTRLEFNDVEGRATCQGRLTSVQELKGTVNGGPFELAASLDRSGRLSAFEGHLRARDVELADGMNALEYLVPVLAGGAAGPGLDGKLTLDLYLRGQGCSREALARTLVGHGSVALDPVKLDGSRLLDDVGRVVDLPPQGRVGSARSDLVIKDGKIVTDNLTLDVAKVPVVLAGSTGFDGRLSYKLRTDGFSDRLPSKAREFLSELSVDLDDVAEVRLSGTVDDLVVTVDGVALDPAEGQADDRQIRREIGRKVLDRIRR
jgi:AsmA protein